MTARIQNKLAGEWLFYGLLLLILWLPVPYGSNMPWAMALMGIVVFLLLGLWLGLALSGRAKISAALVENRWMLLIWVLWLGWIACQLIPLTMSQLDWLSPYAAQLAHAGLSWGVLTAQKSISISPERTCQSFLESGTYFALYLLVLLVVSSRERLRLLAATIAFSGMLQAVYGSIMVLSGLEYGFFEKKTAYIGYATGTFVNRNHLAGYLEICASVGIGLVVSELSGGGGGNWRVLLREMTELLFSRKFRMRIFIAIIVIGLVMTRSRMGSVAFFAALMLCGSLYVLLRERRLFLKSLLLFASFMIVDLLIVSNWFGLEQVANRVEQTQVATEERALVFPEWAQVIDRYWLTGSGLGTFSIAALPFRVISPKHYYLHAHNDYAEFLIETGVIGLAILGALILATVVHALRVIVSRRNRLRTGIAFSGLMAICAIAIHSTVDFNLQIPANAATLIVVLAMVNSCSHKPKSIRGGEAGSTAQNGLADNLADELS